jgi:glycosyltransferase involved in cell wall biosynthesis
VIYERASAGALGVMLGAALRIPVVTMVLDENVSWLSLRGARRIVATAPQLVPARFRDKLERVSWGANVDRFRPEADGASVRRSLGFSPDDVVVGYSGAFYPWHGLETLVDAAALVLHDPRGQRVRYLLVGDGKVRDAIARRIAERDLSKGFRLTGRVSYQEVPRYIAACDLCVAPFDPGSDPVMRKRGMFLDPLKVFEYLAAGKPTITIDSANLRALFDDRTHVILTPPGDAARLAAVIGELGNDPELRDRLGRAGRAVTVERYSWQAHVDQLERVFESVVAAAVRTPSRSVR